MPASSNLKAALEGDEYLQKHGVPQLFDEMVAKLLEDKPDNPSELLMSILKKWSEGPSAPLPAAPAGSAPEASPRKKQDLAAERKPSVTVEDDLDEDMKQQAALREAFDTFDQNKDNEISLLEVCKILKTADGQMAPVGVVAKWLNENDEDGDTTSLVFGEFIRLADALKGGTVADLGKLDVVELAKKKTAEVEEKKEEEVSDVADLADLDEADPNQPDKTVAEVSKVDECNLDDLEGFDEDIEQQDVLRKAFDTFDKNEDGSISVDEFCKILVTTDGQKPPVEAVAKLIADSDVDDNKKLQFGEFVCVVDALKAGNVADIGKVDVVELALGTGSTKEEAAEPVKEEPKPANEEPKAAEASKAEGQDIEALREVFKSFDKNGDDQMSVMEFSKLLVQAPGETPPIDAITKFFFDKDMDGSCALEFDEFLRVAQALKEGKLPGLPKIDVVTMKLLGDNGQGPEDIEALKKAFDKFDDNKDGSISLMEFSKMLVNAPGESPPIGVISKFFYLSDEDDSRRLEFLEFLKVSAALKAGKVDGLGELDVLEIYKKAEEALPAFAEGDEEKEE